MSAGAPLDGVRVVDFGQYIAAPGAGQNLADLGADVVKVEAPSGDQARSVGAFGAAMVRANNRGKRSLAVDLRHPDGAAAVRDLVATADVVLHNFRPGVSERLGLGAEQLRAADPRLVYGFVTGFGTRGPSASRLGLDIAAQAEFGLMDVTGDGDGPPQRVGFAVADVLAAQALTSGVLAALLRRATTGEGVVVETSLMEAMVHAQSSTWAELGITGEVPRRRGNGQALAAPAADLLTTRDGGAIVVSAYTEQKFAQLCYLLGCSELVTDPRFASNEARVAHRPAMLAELGARIGRWDRDDAARRLREAGIVCGVVRRFDEVRTDPDLSASGLVVHTEDPDDSGYDVPGLPFSLDDQRHSRTGAAPAVGQHTRELLRELGRDDDQIRSLTAGQAVHCAPVPRHDEGDAA